MNSVMVLAYVDDLPENQSSLKHLKISQDLFRGAKVAAEKKTKDPSETD